MTAENEQHQHAIPQEAVAVRAYELYCARGCQDGHDLDDWLQAEAELREQAQSVPEQPVTPAASVAQ